MANSRSALSENTNWSAFGEQGHTGGSMSYGMNMPARSDNQPFLVTATKEDLIRANNFAYISLLNEKMILLSRLEAQNLLVTDLRAIIASSRPAHTSSMVLHGSEPTSLSRPLTIPSTVASTSAYPTDTADNGALPKTTPPPVCDRVDYPAVKLWTKKAWTEYGRAEEERGRDVPKLGFLTDEDGVPISKDRMSAVMATARSLFVEIYRARYDPETWRVVSNSAATYFNNKISTEYPEFQLCDEQWKCNTFATIQYPTWKRDHRAKGKLTRNHPSIQAPKRKLDSELSESSSKRKGKKRPKTSIPSAPLDFEVNDITGTTPLEPLRSAKHATSSEQEDIMATAPAVNPPTSPTRPASSPSHPASSPSHPASSPGRPASSPLRPISSPIMPAIAASSSNPQASKSVARPKPRPVPRRMPQPVTVSATQSEDENSHSSGTTTVTPSAADAAPRVDAEETRVTPNPKVTEHPAEPVTNRDSNVATRGRRRNVLDNLAIPKPSTEIPYQPPSAAAVENAKKKPTIKGVQPTKALSARNLFMTDYLKDNGPVTAAEFKVVYDSLDEVTQKKYDDLCKHLKAEKRAPKAPVDAPQEPAAPNAST